jgi:stage III sporulation protein SpoIIIAA
VLGAAGQAKTDLLRDVARIPAQPPHRTVAVVDLFGDLGGSALSPAAALGRALRLYVNSHDEQVCTLSRLVADIAPSAVVVGRASSPRELDALRILATERVQVVAALPCRRIMQCVAWPACYPLLGLQATTHIDTPAVRVSEPVVDAIVELLPQDVLGIYTGVAGALDHVLTGRAPLADLRELTSYPAPRSLAPALACGT